MSDGIKFQDVPEVPQESREVAEVKQQLDRATIEPEALVEGMVDSKVSEAVQEAFVAAIQTVQSAESFPAGSDHKGPAGDSGGKADFGSETSNPAKHYSGVNLAQGEVEQDSDLNNSAPEGDVLASSNYRSAAQGRQSTVMDSAAYQATAVEGAAAGLQTANQALKESEGESPLAVENPEEIRKNAPGEQVSPPEKDQQHPAVEEVLKVDDFTWKMGVAKDEVGDFRTPSLHAAKITPPEEPTADDRDQPIWGDGPAPPGSLSRADESLPKDRRGETPSLIPPAEGEDSSSNHTVEFAEKRAEAINIVNETNSSVINFAAISKTQEMATRNTSDLKTNAQVLDEELEAQEEKLNTIGDDAELADIDLESMLEEQQETIDMLSNLTDVLGDTADAVIRKMSSGLTGSAETPDTSGESVKIEVDDAQQANIDLQNMLQKQQQTIQMMSQLSKILNDTASAVVRKMDGGGSDPSDSSESSIPEQGETIDSQLDAKAAALVDAMLAGEASADIMTVLQEIILESLADASQDLVDMADQVKKLNEMKNNLREEISELKNELSDWPEGESREITINTREEEEDGNRIRVETTMTMTRQQAQDLLTTIEEGINEAESGKDSDREEIGSDLFSTPYELVSGSIIVESVQMEFSGVSVIGDGSTEREEPETSDDDPVDENPDQDGGQIGSGSNFGPPGELPPPTEDSGSGTCEPAAEARRQTNDNSNHNDDENKDGGVNNPPADEDPHTSA